MGKSIQIDSRLVLFSVWREKGVKSNCLMSVGFHFGAPECFGTRQRWWFHNIVNVLNATELRTLKWLILSYVNFTQMNE